MLGLVFLAVTGVFLIPFTAAAFYFFLGIRSCLVGKRENNRAKMIGGYNTIAYSLLAMFAIFFIWYIIVAEALGVMI